MALNQKEKTTIKDLQTQEQTCIKKYKKYGQDAKDPVLKELFSTLEKNEQKHYDTLGQILEGKVQLADERKLAGVPVRLHREKDRKEKRETTRFHGIPVLSRQDDSAGKHHVELHTESQPCRKERENHMVRCDRNSVIHGLLEQYRHIRHVPAKGQALCEC